MVKRGLFGLVLCFFLISFISGCDVGDGVEEVIDNESNNDLGGNLTDTNETSTNSTQEDNGTEGNSSVVVGTCTDSDGGKIFDTLGYIKINGSKTYLDSCISEFNLREYYCNDTYPGTVDFEVFGCFDICENGVCIVIETNTTNSTNDSNSS